MLFLWKGGLRFSDLSICDVIIPSLDLQCVPASTPYFSSALARSHVPVLREGKWRAAHFQKLLCCLSPSASRAPAGTGWRLSVMIGESLGLGSNELSKPVAFFSLESSPMINRLLVANTLTVAIKYSETPTHKMSKWLSCLSLNFFWKQANFPTFLNI